MAAGLGNEMKLKLRQLTFSSSFFVVVVIRYLMSVSLCAFKKKKSPPIFILLGDSITRPIGWFQIPLLREKVMVIVIDAMTVIVLLTVTINSLLR